MIVAYTLFSMKLTQAMDESKYAVCMFYNAQFDIFNGLTENFNGNNYSFLGFDRLESYTEIFKEELTFFSDLKPQFIDICLLYTSPSPRDGLLSRMPSSA